jgi:hypothetical protein
MESDSVGINLYFQACLLSPISPSPLPSLPPVLNQVLAEVSDFLDASSLQTSVTPCLGAMAEKDADGDVRFYAALALQGKEEVSMASGEDNLSTRSVAVLGGGGGEGEGGRDQGGGS